MHHIYVYCIYKVCICILYVYVYIFIFTSLYECIYEMHIVVYLCTQQINIKETTRLFLLLLLLLLLSLSLLLLWYLCVVKSIFKYICFIYLLIYFFFFDTTLRTTLALTVVSVCFSCLL